MYQKGGHAFWNTIPIDSCKFQHYSVLYEGFCEQNDRSRLQS